MTALARATPSLPASSSSDLFCAFPLPSSPLLSSPLLSSPLLSMPCMERWVWLSAVRRCLCVILIGAAAIRRPRCSEWGGCTNTGRAAAACACESAKGIPVCCLSSLPSSLLCPSRACLASSRPPPFTFPFNLHAVPNLPPDPPLSPPGVHRSILHDQNLLSSPLLQPFTTPLPPRPVQIQPCNSEECEWVCCSDWLSECFRERCR